MPDHWSLSAPDENVPVHVVTGATPATTSSKLSMTVTPFVGTETETLVEPAGYAPDVMPVPPGAEVVALPVMVPTFRISVSTHPLTYVTLTTAVVPVGTAAYQIPCARARTIVGNLRCRDPAYRNGGNVHIG
jgi:hypothetical protein